MKKLREFLADKVVKFGGYNCTLVIRPYNSGRVYMQLIDKEDGMPVARVSLDMDPVPVNKHSILLKSYSENEGIYEALLAAGIIRPVLKMYQVGFSEAHYCEFNFESLEYKGYVIERDNTGIAPVANSLSFRPIDDELIIGTGRSFENCIKLIDDMQ